MLAIAIIIWLIQFQIQNIQQSIVVRHNTMIPPSDKNKQIFYHITSSGCKITIRKFQLNQTFMTFTLKQLFLNLIAGLSLIKIFDLQNEHRKSDQACISIINLFTLKFTLWYINFRKINKTYIIFEKYWQRKNVTSLIKLKQAVFKVGIAFYQFFYCYQQRYKENINIVIKKLEKLLICTINIFLSIQQSSFQFLNIKLIQTHWSIYGQTTVNPSIAYIIKRIIAQALSKQRIQELNAHQEKYFANSIVSMILKSKIFSVTDNTSKQSNENRQILLLLFRSQAKNFINNSIFIDLIRIQNDEDFLEMLTKRWQQFQRFIFHYYTLLIHSKQYYEGAFRVYKATKKAELLSEEGVYPIPAVGLSLFKVMILERFKIRIQRIILQYIYRQRKDKYVLNDRIKTLFQIIWSCSLEELARIKLFNQNLTYYKQQKRELSQFENKVKKQAYMKNYIYQNLIKQVGFHFCTLYAEKLAYLSSIEAVEQIVSLCQNQQRMVEYYFPQKLDVQQYLNIVYEQLILVDIDRIICKDDSLRNYIEKYNYESEQYVKQIKLYFCLIDRVEDKVIHKVIEMLSQVISNVGIRINKKVSKYREHIGQMLSFKKSMNRIFQFANMKSFRIQMTIEKEFKKLMDGLEISKNLAQYTDYVIKQCSKLKLDNQAREQNFKDIFLLLNCLSAKDSYLIYHQELLSKRIIDCLNEPKIQIQKIFLELIAEQLGTTFVTAHLGMLKDILTSMELTQKYSNKMPFLNYRWSLKIYNPTLWPDSFVKSKLKIRPPSLLQIQMNNIQEMYHSDYSLKYLNWSLEKGVSLFEGKFKTGKLRFQSENIYLMILLHINERQDNLILYGNLKEFIQCEKQSDNLHTVEKYILVLIENGFLLRKEGLKGENLSLGQTLALNNAYKPPVNHKPNQIIQIKPSHQMMKQFHLNNIQHSKILKERQKLIEAVLVKLLKHAHATNKNCITFQQMYSGIQNHSFLGNFNFSENVVKQRLQQLISKEYCIRDDNDRKIYHYIA